MKICYSIVLLLVASLSSATPFYTLDALDAFEIGSEYAESREDLYALLEVRYRGLCLDEIIRELEQINEGRLIRGLISVPSLNQQHGKKRVVFEFYYPCEITTNSVKFCFFFEKNLVEKVTVYETVYDHYVDLAKIKMTEDKGNSSIFPD